jgi:ribosomal protein S18 acetylase RimI-like enzyme
MQANKIIITLATIKDAVPLTELGIRTFTDTFSKDNKKEDMDKYVSTEMNLDKITSELRDARNVFFLAYNNSVLSGYAKVRTIEIPIELTDHKPLEIERIYVRKEYQGSKVGAALMQQCIDHALSNNCDVIWLGVWELNHKAVNFYKRWGFEQFGSHPFVLGDDHQTDILMKKYL